MGNFKTIKKKEYFGLNSFFMSDVSLGVAFVVLEVLIATSPPPPPFKVILGDNLSAGAIIGVGDCKRGGPRGSIEIETPSILQTQAGTRVFPQILCGEEMDDRFATFFELSNFPSASYLGRQCMHSVSISQEWRIQGRAGTICTEGGLHCTTLLRIMLGRKIILFKALFP